VHIDPFLFISAPSDKREAEHIDLSFFGCLKRVSVAVSSQKESRQESRTNVKSFMANTTVSYSLHLENRKKMLILTAGVHEMQLKTPCCP